VDLVELARTAESAVPEPEDSSEPVSGWVGSTGNQRWWRIRCRDVVNRDRSLTVLVDRGTVVVVGPPGETAVLSAGQLGQLRVALREAADQAER
jgi:hypothetical protein